jgi:hypothetical protein
MMHQKISPNSVVFFYPLFFIEQKWYFKYNKNTINI